MHMSTHQDDKSQQKSIVKPLKANIPLLQSGGNGMLVDIQWLQCSLCVSQRKDVNSLKQYDKQTQAVLEASDCCQGGLDHEVRALDLSKLPFR